VIQRAYPNSYIHPPPLPPDCVSVVSVLSQCGVSVVSALCQCGVSVLSMCVPVVSLLCTYNSIRNKVSVFNGYLLLPMTGRPCTHVMFSGTSVCTSDTHHTESASNTI
jgi:hypothetical protein